MLPEEIESAEPNAWSGKLTARVYQAPADVEAWLSARGLAAFASSDEATQTAALIRVTDDVENTVSARFRGRPVNAGQYLLLPARGAYDARGHLLLSSGDVGAERAVRNYLEGIALLAEAVCAGSYMELADPGSRMVKSESTRRGRVEYREGAEDPMAIATNHPEAWRKIRNILPRMV